MDSISDDVTKRGGITHYPSIAGTSIGISMISLRCLIASQRTLVRAGGFKDDREVGAAEATT